MATAEPNQLLNACHAVMPELNLVRVGPEQATQACVRDGGAGRRVSGEILEEVDLNTPTCCGNDFSDLLLQLNLAKSQVDELNILLSGADGAVNVHPKEGDGLETTVRNDPQVSRGAALQLSILQQQAGLTNEFVSRQQAEIARLSLQNKHLVESNSKYQRQVAALKQLFAEKVRDNTGLSDQLRKASDLLSSSKQDLEDLSVEKRELNARLQRVMLDNVVMQQELNVFKRADGDPTTSDCADLNRDDMAHELARLQSELLAKTELLQAASTELEEANHHLQQMNRSLTIKTDAVSHLTRELCNLQNEAAESKQALVRLRILEEELKDIAETRTPKDANELSRLKTELRDKEQKLKEAAFNCARFESQLAALQNVLTTKNQLCHRLEGELRMTEAKAKEHHRKLVEEAKTLRRAWQDAEQRAASLEALVINKSEQKKSVELELLETKSQVMDLLEGLGVEMLSARQQTDLTNSANGSTDL